MKSVLKSTLAVIVGYVAMFCVVFLTFTVAYLLMGTEGAFQPGSYDVSTLWIVTSIALGLLAAVIGGLVCFLISRNRTAPTILAILVLVLGLLMAIPVMTATEDAGERVRDGNVGSTEAMQNAVQPVWMALLNPFLGAAGVLVGSRLRSGD